MPLAVVGGRWGGHWMDGDGGDLGRGTQKLDATALTQNHSLKVSVGSMWGWCAESVTLSTATCHWGTPNQTLSHPQHYNQKAY